MRILRLTIFALSFSVSNSFAQNGSLLSPSMDSLGHDNLSLAYLGNGNFVTLRSCYVDWIEVSFDSVSYDPVSKRFFIQGRVYNDNKRWFGGIPRAQLIRGVLTDQTQETPAIFATGNRGKAEIDDGGEHVDGKALVIKEILEADSTGSFSGVLTLTSSSDELCVVPCENEDVITLALARFYRIGKLWDHE